MSALCAIVAFFGSVNFSVTETFDLTVVAAAASGPGRSVEYSC